MTSPAPCTTRALWAALEGPPALLDQVEVTGARHALPSPYDVTGLASASVAVAHLALAELHGLRLGRPPAAVQVDRTHAALAFRCERHVRPQGWQLPAVWDPLAGDYRARGGFVRLHTNYAHHRDAVLAVLGVPAERPAVAEAVAAWDGDALESAVVAAGGCAALMRSAEDWRAHPQGRACAGAPPVARACQPAASASPETPPAWAGAPAPLPLSGIRVLDLTRVIAGPVGTRLLAAYGADVLRIDPPGFAEVGALLTETTVGKRRAALDLKHPTGRTRLQKLLWEGDVLVQGYRANALTSLGFGPEELRADYPRLVVTRHNAFGFRGPWADRRGFDSLVQMACGIAARGQAVYGSERPHPLPAQALDHATGYLGAAATCRALSDQLRGRGATRSTLSLAATASALMATDGAGDPHAPEPSEGALRAHSERADTAFGPVQRIRLPGTLDGLAPRFPHPAGPLGSDPADFGDR